MRKRLDILAFSPHPDDVELGCAGSLLLALEKGRSVAVVDVTEGERATRGGSRTREREREAASRSLGLGERLSLGIPDTEVGGRESHRLAVIGVIRKLRPRIVLAPYWRDRHPDHANTGRLVKEAFFYAGVRRVGEGPPYRPDRIFHYMIHEPFTPTFVVDITTVWDRKMTVIRTYRSQFQPCGKRPGTAIGRPEFMRVVEARAVWFGAMIGVPYGEPFVSVGPVPLEGIPCGDCERAGQRGLPPYNLFG